MIDTHPNEEALVARAVAGDADAFGELYRLHREAIYRFVWARVGNQSDAEDLTEQVFLKAWEALPGYQQRGLRFSSWLYQIARNLAIDLHRAQRPVDPTPLSEHPEVECRQATALDRVIEAEQSEALATAVSRLPRDQRQVIILRFFRGLDHAEVARVLAKSKGATRIIQHRALAALNQMLGSTLLTILILVLLLGGSAVYASGSSLPGETLYPLKRAAEQAEQALTFDDHAEARLHLRLAERRLSEAAGITTRGRTEALLQVLDDYTTEMAHIRSFLSDMRRLPDEDRRALAGSLLASEPHQEAQLATIRQQAPESARQLATQAANDLRATGDQARANAGPPAAPPPAAPTSTHTLPTPSPTPEPAPAGDIAAPTASAPAEPSATMLLPDMSVSATPTQRSPGAPPVAPPTDEPPAATRVSDTDVTASPTPGILPTRVPRPRLRPTELPRLRPAPPALPTPEPAPPTGEPAPTTSAPSGDAPPENTPEATWPPGGNLWPTGVPRPRDLPRDPSLWPTYLPLPTGLPERVPTSPPDATEAPDPPDEQASPEPAPDPGAQPAPRPRLPDIPRPTRPPRPRP